MDLVTITSGPDTGKTFPLSDSQIIGRLKKNAIPIRDTRSSREHARLYRKGTGYSIVDLNSKNGIIVNGQQTDRADLDSGDEFCVGETWFDITFEPASSPKPASAASDSSPRIASDADVRLRDRDGSSTGVSAQPIRTASMRNQDNNTRTSLLWLRTDLSQSSGLYKVMLVLGFIMVAGGLGFLAFLFAK